MLTEEPQTKRNGDGSPLYVSWSQLQTWNDCPRKFKLSYLDRFPKEPQGPFIGGHAVHAGAEFAEVESLWKDDRIAWAASAALDEFEHELAEAGGEDAVRWGGRKSRDYPNGEDAAWWRFYIPVMVKRYAMVRRNDELNGLKVMPGGAEFEVKAKLHSGLDVTARIDTLLVVNDDGEVRVRDLKAGKPGGASKQQLAIYGWAIRQAKGWTVTTGEFVYLRDGAARTDVYRIEHLIDEVEDWFYFIEPGMRSGRYPMSPSFFCKSCPVRLGCPEGQIVSEEER